MHGAESGEVAASKRFFIRGWSAAEQAAQGSEHSPKLPEFRESLDNALRYRV